MDHNLVYFDTLTRKLLTIVLTYIMNFLDDFILGAKELCSLKILLLGVMMAYWPSPWE